MNEDFHRIYKTLAALEQQVAEQKQQIEKLTEKQEQAQAKLDRASTLLKANLDSVHDLWQVLKLTSGVVDHFDSIKRSSEFINVLDARTFELRDLDFNINQRLNRIYRAHNRHVLSTVEPRKQAPGWARNKARDRRTWAKQKGWRL